MPSATAMSAACAFPSASLIPTNVSRINTKTTVLSVEKICFRRVSPLRTYHVVMRSMLTVFASWLDSITVAPFAKKLSCRNNLWQLPGKPVLVISPSTPCQRTCNALWTSCATTAKRKVEAGTGIFWGSSARSAILSIQL